MRGNLLFYEQRTRLLITLLNNPNLNIAGLARKNKNLYESIYYNIKLFEEIGIVDKQEVNKKTFLYKLNKTGVIIASNILEIFNIIGVQNG